MFQTGIEEKPTGKQLFEKNKQAFEDLTLEDSDLEGVIIEETKNQEDEDEDTDFKYDRALYDDGLAGEDVDFD